MNSVNSNNKIINFELLSQKSIDYLPKISVVVTFHNLEKYAEQSITSILAQTLKEIEVICIDDGSTDNTLKLLEKYARIDTRITLISAKNVGAGNARNIGIKHSCGEYLSILDGDDFFDSFFLESMYNLAKKDQSDVVLSGYYIFDEAKQKIIGPHNIAEKYICNSPFSPIQYKNEIFKISTPVAWNKIIHKKIFIDNNISFEALKIANDLTAVMMTIALCNKISISNGAFVYYRINSKTNTSHRRGKYIDDFFSAICRLRLYLKNRNLYNTYKRSYLAMCLSCMEYELDFVENKDFALKNAEKILPKALISIFLAKQNIKGWFIYKYWHKMKYKILRKIFILKD